MTDALKLKKLADEHICEYHWSGIPVAPNLTICVNASSINDLCDFIGDDVLMEITIDCILKNGYIVIPHFELILENFYLDEDDIDEIFPNLED